MVDTKKKPFHIDGIFLLAVMSLVGLGIVIIYSSSGAYAESKNLPNTFFLISHFKKVLVGFFAMIAGLIIPFSFWKRAARPMLLITFCLLIALLTSSTVTDVHGAKRWISIGGIGLQPSELAKVVAIFFLGRFLVEKENVMHQFRKGLISSLIVVGLLFILVLAQPDYSSAAIILTIAATMIFSGGAKIHHLFSLSLLGIPALGILMVSSPYRMQRVVAFLNPSENTASSYQSMQSLISLGNGGLSGTGLGTSTQKLGYLPMPFTDTIFSILGEELGLVGTALCLSLFALLVWRGLRISFYCADRFGSLIALGIISSFSITVIMHVGVCSGFFPTTGQPLPFVSYGGTALISMMFLSGIVLNISGYPTSESAVEMEQIKRKAFRGALAKQRIGV